MIDSNNCRIDCAAVNVNDARNALKIQASPGIGHILSGILFTVFRRCFVCVLFEHTEEVQILRRAS